MHRKKEIHHDKQQAEAKDFKQPLPSLQLFMINALRNLVAYSRYFGVPIFAYETWRAFTGDCDPNGKRLFSDDCNFNAYCMAATTALGNVCLTLIDNALLTVEKKLNGRDPNAMEITLTLKGLDAATQAAIRAKHNSGHLHAGITFKQ